MEFNPRNILVIDFGQIGDVVLSLPALDAIKRKFENSRLTVLVGERARSIVEMSGLADEIIPIDRYALRDSNKFWSIAEVFKIIANVRKYKFDFVIDLHSLPETNLLGFLSGAKLRLFANRGNRSLDFLSNFRPKPPTQDRTIHKTDDYLRNLISLGIENAPRIPMIRPRPEDVEFVKNIFREDGSDQYTLVGLCPGAGNPLRRWDLRRYAELAEKLSEDKNLRVLVFLGPEEKDLAKEISKRFSSSIKVISSLNLKESAAAFSFLNVFVGNDSGPIHLATALGVPAVLVTAIGSSRHRPLGSSTHEVGNKNLNDIKAAEVYDLIQKLLTDGKNRKTLEE